MLTSGQAETAAGGAAEVLLDLGDLMTGGRRPRRALVIGAWLLTLGGAAALWRWFPWLFDHLPGWAVVAGGAWFIVLIVSLGLFGAAVKYASANNPPTS